MDESTVIKKRASWRIKLEARLDEPSTWYSILVTLIAVIFALILGGVVIAIVGGNPFTSYVYIARASFGSVGVLSDTIVKRRNATSRKIMNARNSSPISMPTSSSSAVPRQRRDQHLCLASRASAPYIPATTPLSPYSNPLAMYPWPFIELFHFPFSGK